MITYELAKQLKDAGFPKIMHDSCELGRKGVHDCRCDRFDCKLELMPFEYPTLSELIEACGKRFDYLGHGGMYPWIAVDYLNEDMDTYGENRGIGQTPEEAVSRLWLALNKK
jgi:hypothetical protein